jgi:hypothetical protein
MLPGVHSFGADILGNGRSCLYVSLVVTSYNLIYQRDTELLPNL